MFVISDTHWFHDNIIGFCDRPVNHDELMVTRWNETVQPSDLVLHLGDVCKMNGAARERWRDEVAPLLNGTKLLILGNHDVRKPRRRESLTAPQAHATVTLPHRSGEWVARAADLDFFEQAGFHVVAPFRLRTEGSTVTFHHYPRDVPVISGETHIHGHIHNNGYGDVLDGPREQTKFRNINVSVEVRDYRPTHLSELLAHG